MQVLGPSVCELDGAPCVSSGGKLASKAAQLPPGRRTISIPVMLRDVAGLVPGACEGKGKGNRFLNDLSAR